MFRLEMLPAHEGDCLWITYGDPASPRHMLVDGGRKATAKVVRKRLQALAAAGGRLELLIITHIDRDHIEGVLTLLEDGGLGVEVGDVWFNGYDHLIGPEVEPFGAVQGERLSKALIDLALPWNKAFGGGRICVTDAPPPTVALQGGMTLTVLSPTPAKLAALRPVWKAECAKAGLSPGASKPQGEPGSGVEIMGPVDVAGLAASAFSEDTAQPNGSSIAVLAEFGGRRVLLGADAHPSVVAESLGRLGAGPHPVDAVKVPHHGSAHNTSDALIDAVACDRWLFSTNGAFFEHPDQSAVARVITRAAGGRQLFFNYRTDFNDMWDDDGLRGAHGYATHYPPGEAGTIAVDLD